MIRFTKEEKIVIIFLLGSLFVGIVALHYRKANPSASVIPAKAGIHSIDSRFRGNDRGAKKLERININKASIKELMGLRHIGPVLASRIVFYREDNGPFTRKDDLKNVKGIGEKTYESLKKQILLE